MPTTPTNYHATVELIAQEIADRQIQVESPEQWDALIEEIRNKFAAHYPESLNAESVTDAIITHFDEQVVPKLHDEIRAAILELYTPNVAREIVNISARAAADQLRKDLEQPIRLEVERDREAITQRLRDEMIESIREELKRELEPSVRRELRDEIIRQLKLDDA